MSGKVIAGIVIALFLGCCGLCGLLGYSGFNQSKAVYAEAENYSNKFVAEYEKEFSPSVAEAYFDPAFLKGFDYRKAADLLRKDLGKIVTRGEAKFAGYVTKANTDQNKAGTFVTLKYRSTFEKGMFDITTVVRKHKGKLTMISYRYVPVKKTSNP